MSRLPSRAALAPAAIATARAPAIRFVWTQVRQALQHVAAIGAFSPYLAAAWLMRPCHSVFTLEAYLGRGQRIRRDANPRVGHAAVRSAVRAGGALLVVILSRIDVRVFEGMLVLVVVVVVCLFLVDSAVSVIARILLAFWSRHVASLGLQWATGNYPAHRRPKRLRLRDRAASRRCFRRDTRLPTIGVPLCSQARLDPGAAGSVLSAEPSRQTRAPQPRWVVHGVMPATKSKHACWVENCGKFVQPLPSQSALVIGSTVDDGVSGG